MIIKMGKVLFKHLFGEIYNNDSLQQISSSLRFLFRPRINIHGTIITASSNPLLFTACVIMNKFKKFSPKK